MKKFNVDKRIKVIPGEISEIDSSVELDEKDQVTIDLLENGSISLPGQKKTEDKTSGTNETRPEDPEVAKQMIVDTINGLDREDEIKWTKGIFGAGKKPDARVLTELLGWEVGAKERDVIWAEIEKAEKEAEGNS